MSIPDRATSFILGLLLITSVNQVSAAEVTDRPLKGFVAVCTPDLSLHFNYDLSNKRWGVKGYKERKFTITKIHIPFAFDEDGALKYLNDKHGEHPMFSRCTSEHALRKSERELHKKLFPDSPHKPWFSSCIKVDNYKLNPYRVCGELAFVDGDAFVDCSDSSPSFRLGINGHFRHTEVSYNEVILELGNCIGTTRLDEK